ncbi:MAG: hypothetical protein KGJ07_03655 [Patescibacteria group bacterium]|nr:hypothetical protein [Patescibacteria group bacterium]
MSIKNRLIRKKEPSKKEEPEAKQAEQQAPPQKQAQEKQPEEIHDPPKHRIIDSGPNRKKGVLSASVSVEIIDDIMLEAREKQIGKSEVVETRLLKAGLFQKR